MAPTPEQKRTLIVKDLYYELNMLLSLSRYRDALSRMIVLQSPFNGDNVMLPTIKEVQLTHMRTLIGFFYMPHPPIAEEFVRRGVDWRAICGDIDTTPDVHDAWRMISNFLSHLNYERIEVANDTAVDEMYTRTLRLLILKSVLFLDSVDQQYTSTELIELRESLRALLT